MMLMNYDSIVKKSLVDGPGLRTVLFMQGCPIRCPGCQNKHLWPEDGGKVDCTAAIALQLLRTGLPVTISGGEPFTQPEALADLVIRLKMAGRHIIVYSGFVYEDLLLMSQAISEITTILGIADVLVDGPYVEWLDHDGMQYRGSSNQRAIDLQAINLPGRVVTLDWDTPEVVITTDGDLVGAEDVMVSFTDMGQAVSTRRCGQREVKYMEFDGPCPFLMCLETGPHKHPICPDCGAVRYGNLFCETCRREMQSNIDKLRHIELGSEEDHGKSFSF